MGSGRFYLDTDLPDPRDVNLWVTQSGPTLPGTFDGIGTAIKNGSGVLYPAAGYFAVDSFQNGGFDSLTLKGTVGFVGAVDITARGALDVASNGVIQTNAAVNLTASYVKPVSYTHLDVYKRQGVCGGQRHERHGRTDDGAHDFSGGGAPGGLRVLHREGCHG